MLSSYILWTPDTIHAVLQRVLASDRASCRSTSKENKREWVSSCVHNQRTTKTDERQAQQCGSYAHWCGKELGEEWLLSETSMRLGSHIVINRRDVIRVWCHQILMSSKCMSPKCDFIKVWCHQSVMSSKCDVIKVWCHQSVEWLFQQWCSYPSIKSANGKAVAAEDEGSVMVHPRVSAKENVDLKVVVSSW